MTIVEVIKKACAALDAAVLVDNNQYSIGRASVFLEFAEAQAKADVADHGLDMNGSTTPEEFIRLTRNEAEQGVLLPCWRCGGEVELQEIHTGGRPVYAVSCKKHHCGAYGCAHQTKKKPWHTGTPAHRF